MTTPQKIVEQVKPIQYAPRSEAELRSAAEAQYSPAYDARRREIQRLLSGSLSSARSGAIARGMGRSSYALDTEAYLRSQATTALSQTEQERAQAIAGAIATGRAEDRATQLGIEQFNTNLQLQRAQLLQSILNANRGGGGGGFGGYTINELEALALAKADAKYKELEKLLYGQYTSAPGGSPWRSTTQTTSAPFKQENLDRLLADMAGW